MKKYELLERVLQDFAVPLLQLVLHTAQKKSYVYCYMNFFSNSLDILFAVYSTNAPIFKEESRSHRPYIESSFFRVHNAVAAGFSLKVLKISPHHNCSDQVVGVQINQP